MTVTTKAYAIRPTGWSRRWHQGLVTRGRDQSQNQRQRVKPRVRVGNRVRDQGQGPEIRQEPRQVRKTRTRSEEGRQGSGKKAGANVAASQEFIQLPRQPLMSSSGLNSAAEPIGGPYF